jgi:rod shape-determining protein MreD
VRPALALLALGWFALIAQGAVATFVPARFCPDLGLLVVVGMGLHWRGVTGGLAMATLLGYTADLLSGSLLGQHALLRLLAFAAARLASRQLNLRGSLPLAVFAAGLTFAYALAAWTLSSFFTGTPVFAWGGLRDALPHALINAALAPWASWLVERFAGWLGDDDSARRTLRFEPGGRPA